MTNCEIDGLVLIVFNDKLEKGSQPRVRNLTRIDWYLRMRKLLEDVLPTRAIGWGDMQL